MTTATTFRTVNETLQGDLEVHDALRINGDLTGTASVLQGGTLVLNGSCGGDLIVEVGGEAVVHGTVTGTVFNRGSVLRVFGIVDGMLRQEAGETTVEPGAHIRQGGGRGTSLLPPMTKDHRTPPSSGA